MNLRGEAVMRLPPYLQPHRPPRSHVLPAPPPVLQPPHPHMNPNFQLSIRDPLPPEDPLGLEAWSAAHVLDTHTGLALAGAVLANIAGPSLVFNESEPGETRGINLAGAEGDSFLKMAVADLTAHLRIMQDGLLRKAKEFTAEELDDAMFDHSAFGDNIELLAKLANPLAARTDARVIDDDDQLGRDLETSDKSVMYEKMIHPRFLIAGAHADMARILSECHAGHGFVAGGVEDLPPGSKRDHRLDELLRLMRGTEITRTAGNRTKVNVEGVRLGGIFLFPNPDFNRLVTERRDFLFQAIPVLSARPDETLPTVDEDQAAAFRRRFNRVATHALSLRRAQTRAVGQFWTTETDKEFLCRQRAFLRELQAVPEDCRMHGAAALPAAMAWTLLMLAGQNNLDDYILDTVFAAARSVLDAALRLFREQDQAALCERRLAVARKLFQRLSQLGPCKRRELVRGFDRQSLLIYEPVIRVLLEAGIFTETAKHVLSTGRVPVARLVRQNFIEI